MNALKGLFTKKKKKKSFLFVIAYMLYFFSHGMQKENVKSLQKIKKTKKY